MAEDNKTILEKANAAIAKGDLDGFLAFCSDDTEWTYVGETTLRGKDAVRHYLETTNHEPPNFTVTNMIAEGDFLTALGDIIMKDEDGQPVRYAYCDVWRFHEGKMVELNAFVIKTGPDA
ncbi:nuclear transport factor 2 family protein [Fibrella sp. WM1]|uniref:nuclear transport factor 2 family protein n=1 Tax=Fibrella musci TaxID=3242485 RepID=UPI0035204763